MGCLPGRSKNLSLVGNKRVSVNENCLEDGESDVNSQGALKINKQQFIQEFNVSPYDKYVRVEVLGEGSYGKVYKIVEIGTNNVRAIKEIKKNKRNKMEHEKIKKEIDILKKLDHPNILKIFEFYESEDYYYIVTEFCEGGELFDKITKYKHFSEKIAAFVIKQLLSAVRYCHENSIIHRDLKPENILLETNNDSFNIKVIDFGTGEIFKNCKFLHKQIGTPYYIAPEVLKNEYNEKCDIWSCGVILYILLSGSPPFYGKNDEEIYASVTIAKFSFKQKIWAQISDNAKNLIKALLEVDINKRPTAEKALNHKWFNILNTADDFETDLDSNINVSLQMKSGIVLKEALKNLKSFRAERKLQQATLYFMAHNLAPSKEVEYLRKIFQKMDENNDGRLEKEEIIKGFKNCKWIKCSEEEIENIMKRVDIDRSGFIEYQEFLSATLDIKKLLTEENLITAFKMFDKDHSGKISSEELRNILVVGNEKSDERVWKKIIKEIDTDGDGEISFEEFKIMMNNLVTSA